MSWQARFLSFALRHTEKRALARADDPLEVRASFERRAPWIFRQPRGVSVTEAPLGDLSALWCGDSRAADTILYFHGGAYIMGSPRTHSALGARIARDSGTCLCLPEYRLAPEHAFPAAVDDAVAAWRALRRQRPHGRLILGGDSAGGGLALALLGEIARQGLPVPDGFFAFSPFTDLTFSGASIQDNATKDSLLPAQRAAELGGFYLQGADPRDPRASPLFADHRQAPPVWLSVAETEILRDDTLRLAERLAEQGRYIHLHRMPDLPHAWPLFQGRLPEAERTLEDLTGWLSGILAPSAGS
ncbi:alpha/beta hydrolase fold domain-containing protein [Chachezhania sediminis]|uniref:alpha/beta hydrolase fold domain-containing protein n=1 Tax=Chachezhania sediminis TaxID=2599291 RepID=UPI00131CCF4F|nr:alpha/beta hydrolase fold domain-containing protein [Chachezhania sediminis]